MARRRRLIATVIVNNVKRKGMSVNGNPSYWIEFEPKYNLCGLKVRKGYTASDATCGYTATGFVGKECVIEYHFSKSGNLIINTMRGVYTLEDSK